jgi:hypothetical protein
MHIATAHLLGIRTSPKRSCAGLTQARGNFAQHGRRLSFSVLRQSHDLSKTEYYCGRGVHWTLGNATPVAASLEWSVQTIRQELTRHRFVKGG